MEENNAIAFGALVEIIWDDAHGSAANVAYELSEIPHAPIRVVSYGVLLRADSIGVSIASERCDETVYRGYSFIPASMLVKVTPVHKKGRKRKLPANAIEDKPPR